MAKATTTPGSTLLTPTDHALVMIDFQSQMAFATRSIDGINLRNNAALLAKSAAGFDVPTIVTTVAEKSFSGPIFTDITDALANLKTIERTSMNSWEDQGFIDAVNATGKTRLVFSGLWTSVCIVGPVLSALEQGFEAYVVGDASGDVSLEAHEFAMQRVIQAGARPITSLQYLLELQRDWARSKTYGLTTGIAKVNGGAYGIGLDYAGAMFGASKGGH